MSEFDKLKDDAEKYAQDAIQNRSRRARRPPRRSSACRDRRIRDLASRTSPARTSPARGASMTRVPGPAGKTSRTRRRRRPSSPSPDLPAGHAGP